MNTPDRRELGAWETEPLAHTWQLDPAKISWHISAFTGWDAGTFEHESMLGRVIADLDRIGVAHIRSNQRTATFHLHRKDYLK